MGIINVLDPQVANLIAAGEVVDRPASVVKELLENAIDAKATTITVEIKHGGITFIRVSDNGIGMTRDDVPVCIRRHATSKIKDEADLDSIMTLGFRGEALAAIGSVSTLRILTKPHGHTMGTQLTCKGGEIYEIIESGCMEGTTIIVEELFANIPARRKFLKKDSSEAIAVSAVVEKIALSRPDLSIKFISDGAMRFSTAGDNDLKNCIYAVLGRDFAKKLCKVEGMTGGIEVTGYIGTPENIRANRNYQNFFINGRYIKSRTAMSAIEQAFRSYIPSDKFPVCVIELRIHPALVDVNVHPSKLEVKFSNEQAVFDAVYSAVRSSLEQNLMRPAFSLKTKEEAKYEAKIINGFVPLKESPFDPPANKGHQITMKNAAVSNMHLYSKHADELPPHLKYDKTSEKKESVSLPFSIDTSLDDTIHSSSPATQQTEISKENVVTVPLNSKPQQSSASSEKAQQDYALSSSLKTEQAPIKEKSEPQNAFSVSSIPRASAAKETEEIDFKILGEAFNSYVLVECDGKILIIDKHAAHERILFEDMKQNIKNGADCQILLVPISVTLSIEEIAALDEYAQDIKKTGFDFTITENNKTVLINAIPSGISQNEAETLFVTVCGHISSCTGKIEITNQAFYEQALYQASCKAAIKAGRIYDQAHINWICKRVLTDPAIRFCPHGRPVAFELTKNDIEHRFKRS